MSRPLCKILVEGVSNPHFVVDCPNCYPGDFYVGERGHLFYFNMMGNELRDELRREPMDVNCYQCGERYEITLKDYKRAIRGASFLVEEGFND